MAPPVASEPIRIRVPGKLMLAGEYAVLAGAPAIVCAVERYLTGEVRPAPRFAVEGNGARWEEGEPDSAQLAFPLESLRVTREYLEGKGRAVPPSRFVLADDLRDASGAKLGLGGSACSSVAVVAGALLAAGESLDHELVYKLAAVAHGAGQKKIGSALDVAAASFGGTLWTWRFDVAPLIAARRSGPAAFAAQLDRTPAPPREALRAPPGILLAFSGTSASTASLVGEIERFASQNPNPWAEFIARTSNACDRLRKGLQAGDEGQIAKAVRDAGGELARLGDRAGTPIVTEAHRRIGAEAERLGIAAKISGAGGGDSCVAIGGPEALEALARSLGAQGVLAVRIAVDAQGVARV